MEHNSSSDVSIVIPTHSEKRWASLTRTITSAQAQTYPAAEIVVVVDHNPEMAHRVKLTFPGVTVLENAYARGASGNRNTGAFHTRTPFIAFLDDDTVASPEWLAYQLTPFADPSVVGTGGGIIPAWAGPRPAWMPDELLWAVGVSYTGMPTRTAPIRNVWSANMIVRRDAFLAVGGFRTGFGKLGDQNRPEDTELCLRMSAAAGGRWMYVPHATIDHEVPADRSTFGFLMRRCYAEGRGKVQMAGLMPKDQELGAEKDYLRRTLPRAVGRNLTRAMTGRGAAHALQAMAVVAAVLAAAWGGGVETLAGLFESGPAPTDNVSV
ncbi:glycosyl transferase family 2 [Actinoplanes lobatus]|uniref:Cellulose synthase/poly-beta-1,6-N-acetylglucosamine synthase-like glycosyltransferase n=1 Tax=Actinoplanes lobatus TaxID=113568 RepID=A0A7W7MGS5_9ACTN|nr:glycosyltransferase family 2 protein [Actinoplanes lobatus]MBB4749704.1 cellulose synthase/poly-beta-1,6-N-acetylglucosamine synthase-like glycosyltransferase [Actinoplanes lobatus]GGN75850.1 glycosyl transferase family 2 [Actinoplanes lobatus]GIE38442.1 glycosyl transferase family 2 [Actinoplanes lobatus]